MDLHVDPVVGAISRNSNTSRSMYTWMSCRNAVARKGVVHGTDPHGQTDRNAGLHHLENRSFEYPEITDDVACTGLLIIDMGPGEGDNKPRVQARSRLQRRPNSLEGTSKRQAVGKNVD